MSTLCHPHFSDQNRCAMPRRLLYQSVTRGSMPLASLQWHQKAAQLLCPDLFTVRELARASRNPCGVLCAVNLAAVPSLAVRPMVLRSNGLFSEVSSEKQQWRPRELRGQPSEGTGASRNKVWPRGLLSNPLLGSCWKRRCFCAISSSTC